MDDQTSRRVEAVRRFNRFYTQKIGVLQEGLLQSPFSLAEMRVLYELAHRAQPTAAELVRDLGLDASYLSRILGRFAKQGLIRRKRSAEDGRESLLSLTPKGEKAFAPLNARSREEIATLLAGLGKEEQGRLVESMHAIERLLGARAEPAVPYVLRPHQPGDIGWVTHRHGALYAQEYGWDERFEALVAHIAAKFIEKFDPKYERCWIAERNNEIVGCVFLVRRSKTVAQLRLLLVEPKARGLGIGRRLVAECLRFAHQVGYKKMMLWTNAGLDAARHLYEEAGFRLMHSEKHRSFGFELVGQTFELKL